MIPWSPRDYLDHYYAGDHVSSDELNLMVRLVEFCREWVGKPPRVIDFGCGPTVHRMAPFARIAEGITLADARSENLEEVAGWIAGTSGFDWTPYFRAMLEAWGEAPTVSNLAACEAGLKSKITSLALADLGSDDPAAILPDRFDIVTSFYCADAGATSEAECLRAISSLSRLLAPGGWLILTLLNQASRYKVGSHFYPNASLDPARLREWFAREGFIEGSVTVEVIDARKWTSDGIESIIFGAAAKPATRGA